MDPYNRIRSNWATGVAAQLDVEGGQTEPYQEASYQEDGAGSPLHDRKALLEAAKSALFEASAFSSEPRRRFSVDPEEPKEEEEEDEKLSEKQPFVSAEVTRKKYDYEGDDPPSKTGALLLVGLLGTAMLATYFFILTVATRLKTEQDGSKTVGFVSPEPGWLYHSKEHLAGASNGTCVSLRERHLYYPSTDLAPSPALLKALREYEEMHARCVGKVRDWAAHFKTAQWGLADCRYIVWKEDTGGLGNQFLSFLSAFEWALLTNRAILLHSEKLKELICDPFPNSSIWAPEEFPYDDLEQAPWQAEFMEGKTSHEGKRDLGRNDIMYLFLRHDLNDFHLNNHFYCAKWQQRFEAVPWVIWDSNQYVGPALFFIPAFEQRLLELFPDLMVTTRIARYLVHPANHVWDHITRVYKAYFAHASSRVGLQVRNYAKHDPQLNVRLAQCMSGEGVLPKPMSEQKWEQLSQDPAWKPTKNASSVISLFVASLDIGYYDYLKHLYTSRPTEDGRLVAVHVESHEKEESHALNAEERALVEIWLLSLSDTLFVSSSSTFGYLASALAARPTYILNSRDGDWQRNGKAVCERAWSSNACYHVKPWNFQCPDEPEHPFPETNTWVPFVKQCQDQSFGLVVIPSLAETEKS